MGNTDDRWATGGTPFLTARIGPGRLQETTYWVNYDIDVPLFLPIYALGRLADYRAIAQVGRAPSCVHEYLMVADWEHKSEISFMASYRLRSGSGYWQMD